MVDAAGHVVVDEAAVAAEEEAAKVEVLEGTETALDSRCSRFHIRTLSTWHRSRHRRTQHRKQSQDMSLNTAWVVVVVALMVSPQLAHGPMAA